MVNLLLSNIVTLILFIYACNIIHNPNPSFIKHKKITYITGHYVGVLVLPGTANQNKLSVLIDLFNL